MYELLGICLVLAALLTINALSSLATAAIWRLLERFAPSWSPRSRVDLLFAMRVSPPVLAIITVSLFLVPSYLNYEPYSTPEVVSKKLASLALVSGLGVVLALWRCARSWWATHSLLREWLVIAYRIKLDGIDIPTFRLPHAFPIIAVVGVIRPRLFIKERVMRLVEIASNGSGARVHQNTMIRISLALSFALVIILGAAVANSPHVLITVHALIEHAVKLLS